MPESLNSPVRIKDIQNITEDLPADGIFLVDKPPAISSFATVYKLRARLKDVHGKKIKVGHCGTLDPLATGLLILVSGKNTKKAGEFSKLNKIYLAEAILGSSSSTYDSEGELNRISEKVPSTKEVQQALEKFKGKIDQVPPIYSAIKVGGQRAYKLARKGESPELKSRQVEILTIELLNYSYPKLKFRANVSSGTYIRSLIHDLGNELEVGAYMSALRRESIGEYSL